MPIAMNWTDESMAQIKILAFLLALTLLIASLPVGAQEPTVIVEDVANIDSPQAFDYLQPGEQIDLTNGATVILGYLTSCLRETIVGGKVTIGERESEVTGGMVTQEYVECHGGSVNLTAQQAETSGVIVLRGGAGDDAIVVYSLHPFFDFQSPISQVTIRRVDTYGKPIILTPSGRTLDLKETGRSLVAGGTYDVEIAERIRTIAIPVYARAGGPLVSRLVRF